MAWTKAFLAFSSKRGACEDMENLTRGVSGIVLLAMGILGVALRFQENIAYHLTRFPKRTLGFPIEADNHTGGIAQRE